MSVVRACACSVGFARACVCVSVVGVRLFIHVCGCVFFYMCVHSVVCRLSVCIICVACVLCAMISSLFYLCCRACVSLALVF